YAGVPYVPVSPSWSLSSRDFGKLRQAMEMLAPGLVFAADGARFEPAIEAVLPRTTAIVVTRNLLASRRCELFASLAETRPTDVVADASSRVNADTIAKILFTSGSAGQPKGVINTHRMLCSNQEMLRTVFRCFADEPPVICDWLPWHHTFGGNHNFGIA